MFLNRNKNNTVYLSKPQFYYNKVGFKGVSIIYACFCDGLIIHQARGAPITHLCFNAVYIKNILNILGEDSLFNA